MQFKTHANPPVRYFTPEEANAILPRVRNLMSRATEHTRRIRERLRQVEAHARVEEKEQAHRDIERLREEAATHLEEIRDIGLEVKGLEAGLVDFPALRNGEMVYLCWKVGEPRVEWWHPLHTGFNGRQRITFENGVRWEWKN